MESDSNEIDSESEDNETSADSPPIPPLDYFREQPVNLVTIRHMSPMEGELAKLKLESEGIPSHIEDREVAIVQSGVFAGVRLQVRQIDEQRALEILDQPAAETAEGEYANENWRCPRCHRRKVEIVPVTGFWRFIKIGLQVLGAGFICTMVLSILGPREIRDAMVDYSWVILLVALLMTAMMVALASLKSSKRCTACGHEWKGEGAEEESEETQTPVG